MRVVMEGCMFEILGERSLVCDLVSTLKFTGAELLGDLLD